MTPPPHTRTAFDHDWTALSRIGVTADGAANRFAWTPVDLELRAWFEQQSSVRGLDYALDGNGNQWAYWGERDAARLIVTGSHLDSVPDGGLFDGPLGIVSAFHAVDLLAAHTRPPEGTAVAIVNFSDEEGARFGTACVGSKLLSGALSPAAALQLRDRDGVTLEAAMLAAGAPVSGLGEDPEVLGRIAAFVELHIEQGRGLVDLDVPLGIATTIWPHSRHRFVLDGEANHAGTTRLMDRKDPTLAAAAIMLEARRIADELGALATFGKIEVTPNGVNAVPSSLELWLDCRAATPELHATAVEQVRACAEQHARASGVALTMELVSDAPETRFDAELRAEIRAVLGAAGLGFAELGTGAGHDAGILATRIPTAMLFVRNPSGVSHSPLETADSDDCYTGIAALAAVLERLFARA